MEDVKQDAQALFARAKQILLTPAQAWVEIASEDRPLRDLFIRYAMPLAAIGPVCQFLHGQIFGVGAFGFSFHPGLLSGLMGMVASYVLSLVGLVALIFIADFVAPKFAGEANRDNAAKLVIYGATASFAAGIFALLPGLGVLSLLGVYSFYLFYTGATPLMKVPSERAAPYTAVTVLCAIALSLVASAVSAPVTRLFAGSEMASNEDAGGKVTLPGGGTIDLDATRKAADQMEAAANNKKPATDPALLKALLPAAIGIYQRGAVETGAMGAVGSSADGTYTAAGNSFHLKVSDMAAMGALASLGGAFGVQQSKQDADGYEKTSTVDGQLQNESWRKSSSRGKFSVVVASRFMIEAEGKAASIDDLKSAVNAIDRGQLAKLAS